MAGSGGDATGCGSSTRDSREDKAERAPWKMSSEAGEGDTEDLGRGEGLLAKVPEFLLDAVI